MQKGAAVQCDPRLPPVHPLTTLQDRRQPMRGCPAKELCPRSARSATYDQAAGWMQKANIRAGMAMSSVAQLLRWQAGRMMQQWPGNDRVGELY